MSIGKKLIIQDDLVGEKTIGGEMKDKLSTEELLKWHERNYDMSKEWWQVKKLINDQWGAEQYFLDTINELQKQLDEVKNERK